MNVRVAYDVSMPATYYRRPDRKTGIYRVVEEVLRELAARPDVAPTLLGLVGGDRNVTAVSVRAQGYHESAPWLAALPFARTHRSRAGLADRYADKVLATLRTPLAAAAVPLAGTGAGAGANAGGQTGGGRLAGRVRAALAGAKRAARATAAAAVRADAAVAFDPSAFDVFHSPFLPLPPTAVTGPLPRVLTVYDLIPLKDPSFAPGAPAELLKKIVAGVDVRRDWVTCISEYTRREFCDFTGMSPDRAFVTPLAAGGEFRPVSDPAALAAVRARYGVPAAGPYFLTLAAPQPRKNLAHLVRAFYRMVREADAADAADGGRGEPALAGATLVLAGSMALGWMYDQILAAIDEAPDLKARVVLAGYVPDEDLSALYSGATAFVFPSLYEGFGLPPLEAMQCGTPTVCADATSLPEVVGDAGLLVPPTDQDALVAAMRRLAAEPGLRAELSRRSVERAKRFSWAACAEQTVAVYRRAADEAAKARRDGGGR